MICKAEPRARKREDKLRTIERDDANLQHVLQQLQFAAALGKLEAVVGASMIRLVRSALALAAEATAQCGAHIDR